MTAHPLPHTAAEPIAGAPVFTNLVLIGAIITTGMSAGVCALYAHTIMPGLHRTDDRTFVGAFQAIDRAIINPLFMATFFGALILTGLAAALHLGAGNRRMLPWLVAAFVLYLAVVIITMAVNVPLNEAIKAAGDPDHINVAEVRRNFNEAGWAAWNLARTIMATVAFGILVSVVVAHSRRK